MDYKTLFHQVGQLYQNLTLKQKIVAASSIVVVVGFLVFLSLYKSSSTSDYDGYSVLFRNVDPADSAQILVQLDKDGVPYKLINEGTILVPTKNVYKERISVASLGIPKVGKNGFEIFDKQDFGATDSEQRVKFQRAIQGELSRTIESLEPIQRATVYIAFPKDSVFTERQVPPTASVVVKLKDGEKLNSKQVDGIKRIVAGSVTNLKPQDVKIVTSDGVAIGDDSLSLENELVAAQIKYKKDYESSYEQKIVDMIGKFIGGKDKVAAKVTIEFDFSTKDSQSEIYDPNSVVRSEQNIEEKREGKKPKEVGGVPGAVSNIGPVQGLDNNNKADELYSKNVANTNYEISKKIIKIKDQYATIKRLTAAVVVDGTYKKDGKSNTTQTYVPLTQNEINNIKSLVEQAVGYNAQRGDEVTVSNFEFKPPANLLTSNSKFSMFINSYIKPITPIIKYLIVLIILYVFYKKVITPFLKKMLLDAKEEEILPKQEDLDMHDDAEDTLEKFKAARKRVEEQLGIGEDFNEDELKYDVLLEKMKLLASERSEEVSNLLQSMVKNDSDFSTRKEL